MKTDCSFYRNLIPESSFGELAPEIQKALEEHLADCRPCAEERELYAATFQQMRAAGDVTVPRHFFVLPEERKTSPWALFRQMSRAWQVSLAAAALALGFVSVVAASRLQVRSGNGVLTLGFGQLPEPVAAAPAAAPAVDTRALQAEIIRVLEERNRKENLEWVRTLRAEIARSNRTLTAQQSSLLESALAGLEARMDTRLTTAARTLEEGTNRSLNNLYQAVSLDRERDTNALNARLGRLAAASEVKSGQTDAILDTLLQVADLRTRQ